jgi:hypothetical protein
MSLKDTGTHYSKLESNVKTRTQNPVDPQEGDMYYNTETDNLNIYEEDWYTTDFTTTTSTSTSTTTTSTSTTTTSTSTSTTLSTSTTISTSTTTTI